MPLTATDLLTEDAETDEDAVTWRAELLTFVKGAWEGANGQSRGALDASGEPTRGSQAGTAPHLRLAMASDRRARSQRDGVDRDGHPHRAAAGRVGEPPGLVRGGGRQWRGQGRPRDPQRTFTSHLRPQPGAGERHAARGARNPEGRAPDGLASHHPREGARDSSTCAPGEDARGRGAPRLPTDVDCGAGGGLAAATGRGCRGPLGGGN